MHLANYLLSKKKNKWRRNTFNSLSIDRRLKKSYRFNRDATEELFPNSMIQVKIQYNENFFRGYKGSIDFVAQITSNSRRTYTYQRFADRLCRTRQRRIASLMLKRKQIFSSPVRYPGIVACFANEQGKETHWQVSRGGDGAGGSDLQCNNISVQYIANRNGKRAILAATNEYTLRLDFGWLGSAIVRDTYTCILAVYKIACTHVWCILGIVYPEYVHIQALRRYVQH